jgi:hypothetical protein
VSPAPAASSAPLELLLDQPPRLDALAPSAPSIPSLKAVSVTEPAAFPNGWSGPRRPKLTPEGHLLLHDLYTLRAPLPDPAQFTDHAHKAAHASALEATRAAFPTLITAAAASPALLAIGYLLLGWVGTLIPLPLVIALGVLGQRAYQRVLTWTAPVTSEDPEETARQYLALLRLGLYNNARDLLALPHDHTPVDLTRLLDPAREEPLGPAFNTVGPVALRDYWRPRLALLDDPAWPLGGLLPRHRLHPGDVHIETLMMRQGGDAALLVVHGHARFAYALLPLVRVPAPAKAPATAPAKVAAPAAPKAGSEAAPPPAPWRIADGELHLRAADIETMRRLATLHAAGAIDDDQLARACAQANLTRPDINQGLTQKILTEQQANRILQHLPLPSTP